MRKKIGNKTLVTILSIFVVALFIGTSITTALANNPIAVSIESNRARKPIEVKSEEEKRIAEKIELEKDLEAAKADLVNPDAKTDNSIEKVPDKEEDDGDSLTNPDAKQKSNDELRDEKSSDCPLCAKLVDDKSESSDSIISAKDQELFSQLSGNEKNILAQSLVILGQNPSIINEIRESSVNQKTSLEEFLAKHTDESKEDIRLIIDNLGSSFSCNVPPETSFLKVSNEEEEIYALFKNNVYVGAADNLEDENLGEFRVQNADQLEDGIYEIVHDRPLPEEGINVDLDETITPPNLVPIPAVGAGDVYKIGEYDPDVEAPPCLSICWNNFAGNIEEFLDKHPDLLENVGCLLKATLGIAYYTLTNSDIIEIALGLKMLKNGVQIVGSTLSGKIINILLKIKPIHMVVAWQLLKWTVFNYCGCPQGSSSPTFIFPDYAGYSAAYMSTNSQTNSQQSSTTESSMVTGNVNAGQTQSGNFKL